MLSWFLTRVEGVRHDIGCRVQSDTAAGSISGTTTPKLLLGLTLCCWKSAAFVANFSVTGSRVPAPGSCGQDVSLLGEVCAVGQWL